jgi:hypothetical protein
MPKLTNPNSPTVSSIYQAYENRHRNEARLQRRLGAASVGQCARRTWFDFRWAHCVGSTPDGRLLRLFETGHLAESRFVQNLRDIGCEVHDLDPATGDQWTFTACGGHLVAKIDAAVLGLPEAPKTWHVGEFKTHSAKSFRDVATKGVRAAKPEHYMQMLVGMHLSGMDRAFYLAVNKDTDELYSERFEYDKAEAEACIAMAQQVIDGANAPARPHESPDKYPCTLCSHRAMCWGTSAPDPAVCCRVTCRGCCHSSAVDGGAWTCVKHGKLLSEPEQMAACDDHLFLPDFIAFADAVDASPTDNLIRYRSRDGTEWSQGNGKASALKSKELQNLPAAFIGVTVSGLPLAVREAFPGATVTEVV